MSDEEGPLAGFGAATREWFRGAFAEPTRVQQEAWASIATDHSTLVVAPTGSGKTLAAFLWALDRLAHGSPTEADEPLGPATRILYISPLKALGVDVERNLHAPLVGIRQTALRLGIDAPRITVGVRSGDTPASERRRQQAHPPDVLITTPESLYLLLTSSARRTLRHVETVIVDEVHAVAGTKRGAHLALSLERLDALLPRPAQRIGLSATVRPLDAVAKFLGGTRPVQVVAPPSEKAFDLKVVVPVDDLSDVGAAAAPPPVDDGIVFGDATQSVRDDARRAGSIWPHLESEIVDRVLEHRSTIVFVNSRGLAERLTARLNEVYDERLAEAAATGAEHGAHSPGAGAPGTGAPDTAEPGAGAPGAGAPGTAEPGTAEPGIRYGGRPARADALADGGRPAPRTPGAQLMGGSGGFEGAPPELARAHHGSVSKETRAEVEDALKQGRLRCVVATSSLELGIDMGDVDLVIQVESPPSVASGLQRLGRAGHQVGEVSRGLVLPKHRADVLRSSVAAARMIAGSIEAISPIVNPLDVLAQQVIAASAVDRWRVDDWLELVHRAAPFATLSRALLDSVLDLLAGKYPSDEFAQLRPRILWDRDADAFEGRPGAQRLAVTSGGTIPDRGMFGVFMLTGAEDGPEADDPSTASAGQRRVAGRRVGELDEEMVYESRVGDVIALGATSWRIRDIGPDQVRVVPAFGEPGRLPFWRGDAVGRPAELGAAIGATTRQIATGLAAAASRGRRGATAPASRGRRDAAAPDASGAAPGAASAASAPPPASALPAPLPELPAPLPELLDERAQRNLVAYIREQAETTGQVPSDRTLVVERNRDELGDWRVILHSPYGRRVHAPWALMVTARVRERFGMEASAVASDDGIVVRVPDVDADPPGAELFAFEPDEVEPRVTAEVGSSALFAARFRENAARALILPRLHPGKRSPLWQQRLRAAQLLEVARRYPDFPIILETVREVLHDVYDLEAFGELLRRVAAREVQVVEVVTQEPSPFARTLLFGYVGEFMYEGDQPLAERRAAALSLDANLLADLLGATSLRELLDPEAIAQVEAELQRLAPGFRARDLEGVADLLRLLGPLSIAEIAARLEPGEGAEAAQRAEAAAIVDALVGANRALRIRMAGEERIAAIEDAARLRDALGVPLPIGVPAAFIEPVADPLGDLVGRHARTHAPFAVADAAARLGLGEAVVADVLRRLELARRVVRGEFTPARTGDEWVDDRVLRRIRARTLAKLRHEVEPVAQAAYARFLPEWQHVGAGGGELRGLDGLVTAIDQLQGAPIPASAWESLVLPARVADFSPAMLDELLAAGEVRWRGHGAIGGADGWLSLHLADTAPLTMPPDAAEPPELSRLGTQVLELLRIGGAMFVPELARALGGVQPASSNAAPGATMGGPATARGEAPGASAPPSFSATAAPSFSPSGAAGAPGEATPAPAPAPSYDDLADALWELAWAGLVTTDSLAPMRAMLAGPAGAKSTSAHRTAARPARGRLYRGRLGGERLAPQVPAHASGRWSCTASGIDDPTLRAQALGELLLDRYGVVTRGSVEASDAAGGFALVYRVLAKFEEAGHARRGYFVEQLGAAQFSTAGAIDRLRRADDSRFADEPPRRALTLAATDPANAYGAALPWPDAPGAHRPGRKAGGLVTLVDGALVLYVERGGKTLLVLDADEEAQRAAARSLADAVRAARIPNLVIEKANGDYVLGTPIATWLQEAGFVTTPRGLRLRP